MANPAATPVCPGGYKFNCVQVLFNEFHSQKSLHEPFESHPKPKYPFVPIENPTTPARGEVKTFAFCTHVPCEKHTAPAKKKKVAGKNNFIREEFERGDRAKI